MWAWDGWFLVDNTQEGLSLLSSLEKSPVFAPSPGTMPKWLYLDIKLFTAPALLPCHGLTISVLCTHCPALYHL